MRDGWFKGIALLSLTMMMGGGTKTGAQLSGSQGPEGFPEPRIIYRIELGPRFTYDEILFLATLQGIVNRHGPHLYLIRETTGDTDTFIVSDNALLGAFREDWLKGHSVRNLTSVIEAVRVFRDYIDGVILWERAVPSTSNVASTLAGIKNAPALLHGSRLQRELDAEGIPTVMSLCGRFTQGRSPKTAAYKWLIREYVDKGRVNPLVTGYLEDAYLGEGARECFPTRDIIVRERGVIFDLCPFPDVPKDDPNQPEEEDFRTFVALFKALNRQLPEGEIIRVWGSHFWWHKYTKESGWTEWPAGSFEHAFHAIITDLNGADVCIYDAFQGANHSFDANGPPPEAPLSQTPRHVPPENGRVYMAFLSADFDVSVMRSLYHFEWCDPRRGDVPIGWAFFASMIETDPALTRLLFKTRTPNDFFVQGTCGAAYGPHLLFREDYLDTDVEPRFDAYVDWHEEMARRTGITAAGEYFPFYVTLQGGFNPVWVDQPEEMESIYKRVAPDGVSLYMASREHTKDYAHLADGDIPVILPLGLLATSFDKVHFEKLAEHSVTRCRDEIERCKTPDAPCFIMATFPWCPPSIIAPTAITLQQIYPELEVLDPYTFFATLRQYLKQHGPIPLPDEE